MLAVILDETKTAVLLVKRKDVPVWVLPGGGIDKGETDKEAVVREVKEETGCSCLATALLATYLPINRLASKTTLYLCTLTQKPQFRLSDETSAIAFFPLSQLSPSFFFLHAQWLKEVLASPLPICRELTEVTYAALGLECCRHPWRVLRYGWTRFLLALGDR